jgi:putative oxidoreductase
MGDTPPDRSTDERTSVTPMPGPLPGRVGTDFSGGDVGLLMLRSVAGGFLLPHGLAEWLGWFDGPGLTAFAGQLLRAGLPSSPPIPFALAAVQITLGMLVMLGLCTRLAALLGAWLLALISMVHLPGGWFWSSHGMEYPVFWSATLLAITLTGGGRLSLESWPRGRSPEMDDCG